MSWFGDNMPIIGQAIDTANGLISLPFNMWQSNRSMHFQEDMLGQQQQFSREMYQRQRDDALADRAHLEAYNSPANMMKLLSQGGINPYTVTGQIGSSQTVLPHQSSVPGAHGSANYQRAMLDTTLMTDIAEKVATIKNINEDTRLKKENADAQHYKNTYEELRSKYYDAWIAWEDLSRRANSEADAHKRDILEIEAKNEEERVKLQLEIMQKTINEKKANISYIDAKRITENAIRDAKVELTEAQRDYYIQMTESGEFNLDFDKDTKSLGFFGKLLLGFMKLAK